jgi:hypothetical protein
LGLYVSLQNEQQADVAQLVEQLIRNQQVWGSNPHIGSRKKRPAFMLAFFQSGCRPVLYRFHRIISGCRWIINTLVFFSSTTIELSLLLFMKKINY